MKANDTGLLAQNEWKRLSIRFPGMYTDDFVVMPDHIHGIIVFVGAMQEVSRSSNNFPVASPSQIDEKSRRLGTIIGAYKSTVARLINGLRHTPGAPVWQQNYYEHIIRDEIEFINIQNYIEENPSRWGEDQTHLTWPSDYPYKGETGFT